MWSYARITENVAATCMQNAHRTSLAIPRHSANTQARAALSREKRLKKPLVLQVARHCDKDEPTAPSQWLRHPERVKSERVGRKRSPANSRSHDTDAAQQCTCPVLDAPHTTQRQHGPRVLTSSSDMVPNAARHTTVSLFPRSSPVTPLHTPVAWSGSAARVVWPNNYSIARFRRLRKVC